MWQCTGVFWHFFIGFSPFSTIKVHIQYSLSPDTHTPENWNYWLKWIVLSIYFNIKHIFCSDIAHFFWAGGSIVIWHPDILILEFKSMVWIKMYICCTLDVATSHEKWREKSSTQPLNCERKKFEPPPKSQAKKVQPSLNPTGQFCTPRLINNDHSLNLDRPFNQNFLWHCNFVNTIPIHDNISWNLFFILLLHIHTKYTSSLLHDQWHLTLPNDLGQLQ